MLDFVLQLNEKPVMKSAHWDSIGQKTVILLFMLA